MDDATAQVLLDFVLSDMRSDTVVEIDEDDLPMNPEMILADLIDSLQTDDSFGVPGSDFTTCEMCGAGGSPYLVYRHTDMCPVRIAESALEEWRSFHEKCGEFNGGGGI